MKLPFVSYVNDMTPKYLIKFMEEVDEGKKRYLVIPDYGIMVRGHSEHTRATFQGILRDGIDNGIMDLSSYQLEFKSKSKTGRTRFGLITAITQSSFDENAYCGAHLASSRGSSPSASTTRPLRSRPSPTT